MKQTAAVMKQRTVTMQYKVLYEFGVKELEEAGVPEAKLDARLLLEHVCGTNRNDLLVYGDREVVPEQEAAYREVIAKRGERIPLQYITGNQEFMGLSFKVNEYVLIPRQDTECLVEEVMMNLHDGMRILDMCTGSGCILLSLLYYSNDCSGVGADISEGALKVASENAINTQMKKQESDALVESTEIYAEWIQSDLFENIQGRFDIIVSNPPYIRSDVIPTLMEEVKDYEPMNALDGMEDGLYFYKKIISDSRDYLNKGGMLYFEIGYDQALDVSRLMEEAGFSEINVVKDLAGLDRVVYATY